ncbi:hypothetical protein V6Z12_D12G064500 [Gossypium hirsutum]
MARAMVIRCFWPPDSCTPLSPHQIHFVPPMLLISRLLC